MMKTVSAKIHLFFSVTATLGTLAVVSRAFVPYLQHSRRPQFASFITYRSPTGGKTTIPSFAINTGNSPSTTKRKNSLSEENDATPTFHFSIDRGGTFTDVHCSILPSNKSLVLKLLSEDPANYPDAPTEGIRRILADHFGQDKYPRNKPVDTSHIGSIRMGTTVATNALLERKGERMGLVITKGFGDLLEIGNQSRDNIFDLECKRDSMLYEKVVEVEERVIMSQFSDLDGEKFIGISGEEVTILKKPDMDKVREQLKSLLDAGIKSLAVVFMHSFVYEKHEEMVRKLAKSMGFKEVALSSDVMKMVKIVSRGHTACAAAYLTPCIKKYIENFTKGFDENLKNIRLDFMKSDGGLTPVNRFGGHQAILSGPAGGVIGFSKTTPSFPIIGFDMGGTSTDVSRYSDHLEHVFETKTAGISIQAPQLDINTVAAGGGSRLFLKRGMFIVGPGSSGAHPGPVCYRKGGYLSVTDANLVLGRVLPEYFPSIFGPKENEPLDLDGARQAFAELTKTPEAKGRSIEELALGFLLVANESMCRPIRNLTEMRGYDLTTHTLACFGGAGPQHACAMAKNLGMGRVFIHRYGGVLSAYGLSMADAVEEESEPANETYEDKDGEKIWTNEARFDRLAERAVQKLVKQGYDESEIKIEKYLNMRYQGTDTAMMILQSPSKDFSTAFVDHYKREFGFHLVDRSILIDDYRIRAVVPGPVPPPSPTVQPIGEKEPIEIKKVYFESGWEDTKIYKIEDLSPGHEIFGPGIIIQPISTVIVEIGCKATITSDGDIDITILDHKKKHFEEEEKEADPIQLSIFSHRFMGIAEQMGRTLARTAISVNIKERLDFSCALFSPDGGLVANAPHIPVHLGAMQSAVRFQIDHWKDKGGLKDGDVLVSNHPQLAGGSHLPDITVITPVFHKNEIIFFVASRGHHADIGGIVPGSMPPHSTALEDEGAMIVAFKLVENGVFQEEGITEILMSPGKFEGNSGTRNLRDNLSDLKAQVAANNSGIRFLLQLVEECSLQTVHSYMKYIQKNAEIAVRSMLKSFAKEHGNRAHAIDYMDDGTPIALSIQIKNDGSAIFDFTGTGPQVLGNHNAPPAVTYSAVIYSLRSLVGEDIPLNQGCLAPIEFIIPKYCLLNPSENAGVVGGNVLTSQRVVDVVLKAFKACAASQGCMNNLTFGDKQFGYYETIAGGAGAGPGWNGRSGVHTHCTNTRITDPEILERRYPVLLKTFSLRSSSGGKGKYSGGHGIIREIEPLRPLTMSILSERRCLRPYGMEGGEDGKSGKNLLVRNDGIVVNIGGRCSMEIKKGERLRIETPGGGGYGANVDESLKI